MSTEFYWVAVIATTIMASARITRLVVFDKFPPVRAVRDFYKVYTEDSNWSLLVMCGYCFSYWATWLVLGSGLACHVYGHPPNSLAGSLWWIAAGSFAISYSAAIVMARDGDQSMDDPDEVVLRMADPDSESTEDDA